MDIGKSTKVALAMKGLKTSWLVEELGVTRQTAWVYTTSKGASAKTITMLADLFDMPVSDFVRLGE